MLDLTSIVGRLAMDGSPEHRQTFRVLYNHLLLAENPIKYIIDSIIGLIAVAVLILTMLNSSKWELSAVDFFLFLFVIFFPIVILSSIKIPFVRSGLILFFVFKCFQYGGLPSTDLVGYYVYHSVNGIKTMWHKKNNHDPYEIVPGPKFKWTADWNLEIPEVSKKTYGGIGYVDPLMIEREIRQLARYLRFVYPDSDRYSKQFVVGELSIIHYGETLSIFQMCNSEERIVNRPACQGTGGAKLLAETTPLKYLVALYEVAEKNNMKLSRWEYVI